MTTRASGETTLPSVNPSLAETAAEGLVLTILFHPEPSRIGESAVLSGGDPGASVAIGREQPRFEHRHGRQRRRARGLSDPHISRCALDLRFGDAGIELARPAGASRCKIAGNDLAGTTVLSHDRLRRGQVLSLGHSVVLHLRLTALCEDDAAGDDFGLLGHSDSMAFLRRQIELAAGSDADVLIGGESGSGKERVAQALHRLSARSQGPFIPVNMAAIPGDLAAAALFGNTRGAFTGATAGQPGLFRQAEGGTLFLDEIGDAPESVQPLLLRALQEREIQVVGGGLRKVNVRVVAATDLDLDAPASGFRGALRHRLAALEIQVPSLAAHAEDIGVLAWTFYQRHQRERGNQGAVDGCLQPAEAARWAELIASLAQQLWPGNVRELDNMMRQIALASGSGLRIPPGLNGDSPHARETGSSPAEASPSQRRNTPSTLSAATLKSALSECNYEIAATARRLGMSRQSLYRRVQATPGLRLAADVPLQELLQALELARGDLAQTALRLEVSATALRTRLRSAGLPSAGQQTE
jgi:two-component system nitrogen regulation response regulator GlnG